MSLDTESYLKRLGISGPIPLNADGLTQVQWAHQRSIRFENFDVLLGRKISTEPADIYNKLVTRRRGGYCFETNTLLCEMLTAFGFKARRLLGRVVFGSPSWVPPRSHTLVLVEIGDDVYIAHSGFGAHTPRSPIRLRDGEKVSRIGRTWRLTKDEEHGWRLVDKVGDEWRDLYVFDLGRVYPMDIMVGNHWTSTCEFSPFLANPLVVSHTDDGRNTLFGRKYTRYGKAGEEARILTDVADFRKVVSEDFEISLDIDNSE